MVSRPSVCHRALPQYSANHSVAGYVFTGSVESSK